MPQWDITVYNITYLRLEAETPEEAKRRAAATVMKQDCHEQRIGILIAREEEE